MITSLFRTRRLKHCVRITRRDTDNPNLPFIGLERVESQTGRLLSPANPESSDGVHFDRGDVLFGKLRPYLAKAWRAEFEGKCTSEFMVLRPRRITPRFLAYVCLSQPFVEAVTAAAYGAKMPRAAPEFVANLEIPLPAAAMQDAIGSFLDRKTAAIDDLIRKKARLIELLEERRHAAIEHVVSRGLDASALLKDSGIPWLGQVPRHWDVVQLRRVGTLLTGTTPPTNCIQYYEPGSVPWFSPSSLGAELEIGPPVALLSQAALRDKKVHWNRPGGVAITTIGATLGTSALMPVGGTTNQQLTTIRFKSHRVLARFGAYYFKSLKSVLPNLAVYTTLPIMTQRQLGSVCVPVPPQDEQRNLLQYLDFHDQKVRSAQQSITRQLASLREYRRALISAAVTGQLDINAMEAA